MTRVGLGYNTLLSSPGTVFLTRAESVLVFGAFIDVPLIVGGFLLMYRFRGRMSREILKVKLPTLVLYLILSIPLIIFEEQIDCMPSWCGTVAISPTLPFLFIEMLVLGGIALWRHAQNALRMTLVFSIYGVLFEIFLGGLRGAPLVIIALLAPYVGVGYAFISMLPLTVLTGRESAPRNGKLDQLIPPASAKTYPSSQFFLEGFSLTGDESSSGGAGSERWFGLSFR